MATLVDALTLLVVAVKDASVAPMGMVTLEGTAATAGWKALVDAAW